MNLISQKFKYLKLAQTLLGNSTVPPFRLVDLNNEVDQFDHTFPSILRSAIKNEAGATSLLSGKSLSISGINTLDELKAAFEKICTQKDLEEVIIQKEIPWDTHLTLVYEKDFFFVEKKGTALGPRFLYWTPIGHTEDSSGLLMALKKILTQLTKLTNDHPLWIMEMGQKENELFLFQIQPISASFLDNLFSQNLVQEMLLSRQRFQKSQALLAMIKTEWMAYKFRKKHLKKLDYHPSWIFLNWEFIFHYFRIYCLQKQLKPDQQSFGEFLTLGHSKSWMGEILRIHFTLANQLRVHETYDQANFVFDQNPALIFIGTGEAEERIGEKIILIDELTPEAVYQLKDHQIILTKTFSLLSHGILAASERKIKVVAGIPEEIWEKFKYGEIIYLDFKRRILQIK